MPRNFPRWADFLFLSYLNRSTQAKMASTTQKDYLPASRSHLGLCTASPGWSPVCRTGDESTSKLIRVIRAPSLLEPRSLFPWVLRESLLASQGQLYFLACHLLLHLQHQQSKVTLSPLSHLPDLSSLQPSFPVSKGLVMSLGTPAPWGWAFNLIASR